MTCKSFLSHIIGLYRVYGANVVYRYPPKMIPGCHITLHTSAKTDKDARLLLSALGLPFYGKIVN